MKISQRIAEFFNREIHVGAPDMSVLPPADNAPAANTQGLSVLERKLKKYAVLGQAFEKTLHNTDDMSKSIIPAAQNGDVDFLLQLKWERPDLFADPNNWRLKESLTRAIISERGDVVIFLLHEAGVNPEYEPATGDVNEIYNTPGWDALFVAATGVKPRDFKCAEGTHWKASGATSRAADQIFDAVLYAYEDKYKTDTAKLIKAIARTYRLVDNYGKEGYAKLPHAARHEISQKINEYMLEMDRKSIRMIARLNRTAPRGFQ